MKAASSSWLEREEPEVYREHPLDAPVVVFELVGRFELTGLGSVLIHGAFSVGVAVSASADTSNPQVIKGVFCRPTLLGRPEPPPCQPKRVVC